MDLLSWSVAALLAVGFIIAHVSGRRYALRYSREAPAMRDVGGMELVASVGGSETEMAECTDTLAPFVLSEKKVTYACGHEYADRFGHDFYGEKMEVNPKVLAKREKCGDCMLAEIKPLIIRCAICGYAIGPGDGVAVYGNSGYFFHKERRTTPDGRGVIGCMRWGCCPSGGFFAGHWSGEAFVPAFKEGSIASHVLATGKAAVVNVEDDGSINVRSLDDEQKK